MPIRKHLLFDSVIYGPDLTYMVALCVAKIHTLSVLAHPFVCQLSYLRKAACERMCRQDAGMAQTWLGAYGCYMCCCVAGTLS